MTAPNLPLTFEQALRVAAQCNRGGEVVLNVNPAPWAYGVSFGLSGVTFAAHGNEVTPLTEPVSKKE